MKYRHTSYKLKIWGVLVVSVFVFAFCVRPADAGESGHPAPDSIGFTFDDGPHPRWTPVVLDVLDAYGVKATFFVQGYKVNMYPELAREIVERGHSIQVHGYEHVRFTKISEARMEELLRTNIEAIYRATGVLPTCFRPPWGATNATVRHVAESVGLTVVLWDFDSRDYGIQSAPGVLRRMLGATAGQDILGHDPWGPIWRDALPPLIEEFRSRGYGFDTVCENYGPFGLLPKMHGPGISIT